MKGKAMGRIGTLAALTLALGGAVALNWYYTGRSVQSVQADAAASDAALEPLAAETEAQTEDTSAAETSAQTEEPSAVETAADASAETQTADAAQAVYDPLETAQTDAADTESDTAGKNYGEAQLVSVSQDSGTEFFEEARLNRTKARDEALDTIQKTLKNTSLTESEKEETTKQLQNQISSITVEADLESQIKARGFADCLVSLAENRADVTVMTENDALTADEVTRIRDVILSRCKGLTAQDITVVEVK